MQTKLNPLRAQLVMTTSGLSSAVRRQTVKFEHAEIQAKRLSLLEPDSPPGHPAIVLDLPDGKRRYILEFSACTNPVCECRVLKISLHSAVGEEDAGPVLSITFEADKALVEHSPSAGALADALIGRLSKDDWPVLYQIFRKIKADCSEISDVAEVTAEFPEDILADPSCLLAYKQIFPWSADLTFTLKGSSWIALERYCTNPDCGCTRVLLDFIRFPSTKAARPKTSCSEDGTLIFLDFRTGTWRVEREGPPGSPTPGQLVATFQTSCPDWKHRFERHHRVLRGLHQRAREVSAPPPPASGLTLQPRKIGRNERCPCGSSKKYKHCCGR